MRIDLGIVRTFPTVGGFRGQHVKVTNLSASPALNWSRDGAIAIDAGRQWRSQGGGHGGHAPPNFCEMYFVFNELMWLRSLNL